jgi:hypothetical protein
MHLFSILITVGALGLVQSVAADERSTLTLRSGPEHVALIELFSSEGCSSCPPADKWVSSLTNASGLWRDFVPVTFHVDYWDGLGWPDRFASPANTARQHAYAQFWRSRSVYTPGFVLNGKEWSGYQAPGAKSGSGGKLEATSTATHSVHIAYTFDAGTAASPIVFHAAWLGFGLVNDVRRGENAGRKLGHDFVALAHAEKLSSTVAGPSETTLRLDPPKAAGTNRVALAVWVQDAKTGRVLQAAGDWAK